MNSVSGDRPFITQNLLLAFALYLAGLPFVDEAKPCLNVYDNEVLKNLGFAGMTLEDGARAALESGKKGQLQFLFLFTPELQGLLSAFKFQEERFAEGSGTVAQEAQALLESYKAGEMETGAALARLGCLILKSRGQFFNQWKGREDLAMVRVPNAGQAQVRAAGRGTQVVSNPGYKVVSLSASAKTKDQMRL